ncbi:uncharacterized protein LOC101718980 [Heterocephalus glaber]|uniref:Uncharacterized protein LOC101718980 n=1 Tax=Heterocephalus glaber TaxID=10181 RepID=A0AAX6SRN9_HETGA|nr:uncharacterized protein LOC101718980 [Heterocephalus glaber]
MAGEPRPGPGQPGQKRQQDTAGFRGSSNYHLNYELHGGDAPCRGYGHQRISPLINQVPGKLQRTFMGLGVRRSCSPYKASRSRYLHPEQAKREFGHSCSAGERLGGSSAVTAGLGALGAMLLALVASAGTNPGPSPAVRTEELRSIRGKLSEIKAQVDRLLESLEHMDQRRAQAAGQAPKGQRTVTRTGSLVVRAAHAKLLRPNRSPGASGKDSHRAGGAEPSI